VSLGFYRKHTESLLRRYLYASMQVGRAPSILSDPIARGWASSRPIRTFEDAVIFVLDIEKCLAALGGFDRQLISRIVLQEYTQAEAATLVGMSVRAISYKFPEALDRLTEKLLAADLLILPR
jgi:DNA-directed RNA polymerase specialized sigma24 family protein